MGDGGRYFVGIPLCHRLNSPKERPSRHGDQGKDSPPCPPRSVPLPSLPTLVYRGRVKGSVVFVAEVDPLVVPVCLCLFVHVYACVYVFLCLFV